MDIKREITFSTVKMCIILVIILFEVLYIVTIKRILNVFFKIQTRKNEILVQCGLEEKKS